MHTVKFESFLSLLREKKLTTILLSLKEVIIFLKKHKVNLNAYKYLPIGIKETPHHEINRLKTRNEISLGNSK